MALTYALSTWPFLEAYLERKDVDPLYCEQLIDAATLRLEKHIDNALVQRSFVERHSGGINARMRGGAKRIFVEKYPIVSVTSIADDQDTPATIAATDYEIEAAAGYLEHHSLWPAPSWKWNVTYVAGRFTSTDTVEEDARLACHALVAHLLGAPQSPVFTQSSSDGNSRSFVPEIGALPPLVAEMIEPYRSMRL